MPKARTYRNPILPGFYPDPSICRVGADYYLVTSSFEYFPGIPIFHSRDLIHYRQIGHVLTRPSQLALARARSSGGIYAPTIRHFGDRFYVTSTNTDAGGNFVVSARRPEGPWSNPKWIDEDGFDPSLFFDGPSAYFTRDGRGSDPSHPFIYAARIDPDAGQLLRKLKAVFSGTGGVWSEASHLYRLGDWYYLVTAEGGTGYDHGVVVARSRKPTGPFESHPGNPVLTHRHRKRHPLQALGHADLVDTPNGQTYAVLLGIRPRHGRYHHLGRETMLVPVSWGNDGWPALGKVGGLEIVETAPDLAEHSFAHPAARDDFDDPRLRTEYVFVRNPDPRSFSLEQRSGHLRLFGLSGAITDTRPVAFVGRRQTHFVCRYRTKLEFTPANLGDVAGLVVRNSELYHYALIVRRASLAEPAKREAQLWSVIAGKRRLVGRAELGRGPVLLEIGACDRAYEFYVGSAARRTKLGRLATRHLSAEYATQNGPRICFTGVVVGVYASGEGRRSECPADFDWFEYTPVE